MLIDDDTSDVNISNLPEELIDLMNLFGLFSKNEKGYKLCH